MYINDRCVHTCMKTQSEGKWGDTGLKLVSSLSSRSTQGFPAWRVSRIVRLWPYIRLLDVMLTGLHDMLCCWHIMPLWNKIITDSNCIRPVYNISQREPSCAAWILRFCFTEEQYFSKAVRRRNFSNLSSAGPPLGWRLSCFYDFIHHLLLFGLLLVCLLNTRFHLFNSLHLFSDSPLCHDP